MNILKYGLLTLFMYGTAANAINPLSDWYAGLLLGGSKAPNADLYVVTAVRDQTHDGVLYYGLLGNVGGQLGYRIKNFRVEGEVVYNNNQYKKLQFPDVTIYNYGPNNNSSTSLQQLLNQSRRSSDTLQLSGYTNTYAFMANGFYDFYVRDYTSHFVPYVGLGVGYALRTSTLSFLFNGETLSGLSFIERKNQIAGQGIVGLSYYLSDYTSFNLDYRYLASARTNTQVIEVRERTSINPNPKLYTINLIFNSAFNV